MSFLDLSGDLLRSTAHWLQPADRLNLALTNKRLFRETWGTFAEEDLTNRFPFESRFDFNLNVEFDRARYASFASLASDVPSLEKYFDGGLRLVPERSRMQHVYLDISENGCVAAILTFDNILRVVDVRRKAILAETDVQSVCGFELWDKKAGRRVQKPAFLSSTVSYEEENGLDVEVGFGFGSDDRHIFISSRSNMSIYCLEDGDSTLSKRQSMDIEGAKHLLGHEEIVGGSSTISPDLQRAYWIVFADSPATAFLTTWDIPSGKCLNVVEIGKIHPRRWSALGWARIQVSPNQRYLISVVNNAKKVVHTIRNGDVFRRVKRSEYIFSVFDLSGSSRVNGNAIRRRSAWLELDSDAYPRELLSFMSSTVAGLELTNTSSENTSLTILQEMRHPGFSMSAMHSCPSEATYKSLSFGPRTRHPWFVTKQPMFSFFLDRRSDRAIVSTAPHANNIYQLRKNNCDEEEHSPRSHMVSVLSTETSQSQYAFRGMPWRLGFASASAFSATGKWLAGVTLVGDKCIVCVRNITQRERLFGSSH